MKIILIVLTLFGLNACKLEKPAQQVLHHHNMCEGLISFFLKTQNLEEYKLLNKQVASGFLKNYTYHYRSEKNIHFKVLPTRANLNFQCYENPDQTISIILLDGKNTFTILQILKLDTRILKKITAYRNP
ncbi:hypothetical protein [Acinetobacter terrestris]|uniref:hypothetical protein n=1 Tax=Acinetobacter terrestris TaxID=2529843 RepID=UPI00103FBBFD|nr:hypothetical protein [Acinetobacter terrestris]TCB61143.1 hypothetical protein E0H81_13305 [Acinetobacter terrestris]